METESHSRAQEDVVRDLIQTLQNILKLTKEPKEEPKPASWKKQKKVKLPKDCKRGRILCSPQARVSISGYLDEGTIDGVPLEIYINDEGYARQLQPRNPSYF